MRSRRVAQLMEGGLFGTTGEAEPFTVLAQTACEVFSVAKADFVRLPYRVISAVQEHHMQATMWRLQQCIEGRKFKAPEKTKERPRQVPETKRKVLAELLHCDLDNVEERGESAALRMLKESLTKAAVTGLDLRAASPK
ncbi:unnamed protein product, partial [Effrenium voratum]